MVYKEQTIGIFDAAMGKTSELLHHSGKRDKPLNYTQGKLLLAASHLRTERGFFGNKIVELAGMPSGLISKELKKLEQIGLIATAGSDGPDPEVKGGLPRHYFQPTNPLGEIVFNLFQQEEKNKKK